MNARDPRFCKRIVSGGQTGADRAALDFAIEHGYDHGGFCPAGRRAEDGRIPDRYQLTELDSNGYRQRTRRNVEGSDGTLILTIGECTGGTLTTLRFAQALAKPYFVVDLANGAVCDAELLAWLQAHQIATLNVAGPRESTRPGMHSRVYSFLARVQVRSTPERT